MTGKAGTLHRGRAAIGNPVNRYHSVHAEAVDDGWAREEDIPRLPHLFGFTA